MYLKGNSPVRSLYRLSPTDHSRAIGMDRLTESFLRDIAHAHPSAPPGPEAIPGRRICTFGAVLRKQGVIPEPGSLGAPLLSGLHHKLLLLHHLLHHL